MYESSNELLETVMTAIDGHVLIKSHHHKRIGLSHCGLPLQGEVRQPAVKCQCRGRTDGSDAGGTDSRLVISECSAARA
jgi:hypothetical protein